MMDESRNERAFTIIEGLVVLSVIAIVASLVLANLRFGQKKTILDNEVLRVAQLIRRAKTNSLGSLTFQGGVPRGGYGVAVDTGRDNTVVMLFADQNGNERFNGDFDHCNGECVERLVLSAGVVIASAEPAAAWDATFLPPNLSTTIRGGGGGREPEARITLAFGTDPDIRKTIVVRDSGEINVQ